MDELALLESGDPNFLLPQLSLIDRATNKFLLLYFHVTKSTLLAHPGRLFRTGSSVNTRTKSYAFERRLISEKEDFFGRNIKSSCCVTFLKAPATFQLLTRNKASSLCDQKGGVCSGGSGFDGGEFGVNLRYCCGDLGKICCSKSNRNSGFMEC